LPNPVRYHSEANSARRLRAWRFSASTNRELSNYAAAGEGFRDDMACTQFDKALDRHCQEGARIVETLAAGSHDKNAYQDNELMPGTVGRFAPVAFGRVRAKQSYCRERNISCYAAA